MTTDELAVRVLQKLMVLEHGETVDTEDAGIVITAYNSAYALLDANQLTTWGSDDDIPIDAEQSIIDYVSNRVKGAFSVPMDVRQTLPLEAHQAEIDLASLFSNPYVPTITPAEYY